MADRGSFGYFCTIAMGCIMEITIWEKQEKNKDGTFRWEHNHIENGMSDKDKPTPHCDTQKKSWGGGIWRKSYGKLIGNKVIKES